MRPGRKDNKTRAYLEAHSMTAAQLIDIVASVSKSPDLDRMKEVISLRAGGYPFSIIANRYGVTRQNILLLEMRALSAVDKHIEANSNGR